MQYQVPQFIEMEDKIIGPMTLKQFGFVAVGGIIIFIIFSLLKRGFAIMLSVPIGGLALALAFAKVKGVPFPKYLMALLSFSLKQQMYFWKKK